MSILGYFMASLALKAAVVFLLGFGVAGVLKRAPASLQNRIWVMAFAGVIGLPLLIGILPGWKLLPSAAEISEGAALVTEVVSYGGSPSIAATAQQSSSAGSTGSVIDGVTSGSDPIQARLLRSQLSILFGWIWVAGTVMVLVWLGAGLAGLSRVYRRAKAVRDPERLSDFAALARRVGVDPRRISYSVSDEVRAPATWGVLRPVILLPSKLQDAPTEFRDTVLLHELIHVRRRAWCAQFCAIATCALYWFNPLAWIACRQLHMTEERAVDEEVIRTGVSRIDYAACLLNVVRTLRREHDMNRLAVLLGRRGSLDARLRCLLRAEPARGISRPLMHAVGLLLILGVAGVAALEARDPAPGDLQDATRTSRDSTSLLDDRLRLSVYLGTDRVEEMVVRFPRMNAVPEGVIEWVGVESPLHLIVEGETTARIVEQARQDLQDRGVQWLVLVSEEDPEDAMFRLTSSGIVTLTIRSAGGGGLLTHTEPVLRSVLASAVVILHVPEEARVRFYFGVLDELTEMGATAITIR